LTTLSLYSPDEEAIMAKVTSLANVTFGATGEEYVKGCTYDVPAELLKKYPDYFKKMAVKPENKAAVTEENK
tara:strand:+ start:3888 stop:4103 length:216 start_codon:yes stop_codon:yes gene_type:complete